MALLSGKQEKLVYFPIILALAWITDKILKSTADKRFWYNVYAMYTQCIRNVYAFFKNISGPTKAENLRSNIHFHNKTIMLGVNFLNNH